MKTITELRRERAAAITRLEALVAKDALTAEEQTEFDTLERRVTAIDAEIPQIEAQQRTASATAQAVAGQEGSVHAEMGDDAYMSAEVAKARGLKTNKGLRAVAAMKMFAAAGGNPEYARKLAAERFGERHSVTMSFEPRQQFIRGPSGQMVRALVTSVGASGGFIIPPDYMNEIIELLRPATVVRSSNPRVIPMPSGTMTLPSQTAPGTASYGTEIQQIAASQQTLGQIVASFKKLTALVPVSNDMMRYADPAVDAFVRDDLVKIIALREDLAFLLGDGTQATPMGFLSFANRWVGTNGGTLGNWSTTGNSTAAVNGASPLTSNPSSGNFITSNETYNLATVAQELGGLVNKLDTSNVPDSNRCWFMNPRSYNYLFNVQNSLGVYVFREELSKGTLLTYPVKRTTQIPINYHDTTSANDDCSFVFLVEMDEAMILDSMSLELAVSREGMYVDTSSVTWSAFQNDQTIIRAIAEHDFQIRHDAAVACDQFVRWAPAIS